MEENKTLVVEVKKLNKSFIINDVETGHIVQLSQEKIPEWMLRKAVKYNVYLMRGSYKDGRSFWRQVDREDYRKAKETGIEIPTKRANRKKDLFN